MSSSARPLTNNQILSKNPSNSLSNKANATAAQTAATKTNNKPIVLRFRGKDGTFREEFDPNTATLEHCKNFIFQQTKVDPKTIVISTTPTDSQTFDKKQHILGPDFKKIGSFGLQHGQMLYFSYSKDQKSIQEIEEEEKKKEIEENLGDGKDIEQLGLKYRKNYWTMSEYLNLVDQVKIDIKHQKFSEVRRVSLDASACKQFRNFLYETQFDIQRIGILFGRVEPLELNENEKKEIEQFKNLPNDKKDINEDYKIPEKFYHVIVEAIYEPKQKGDEEKATMLQDDFFNTSVLEIAKMFGLMPVGWLISHIGKRKFPLIGEEIIQAAEFQAKFGPNFVTVTISPNDEGDLQFEAFQVSRQAVELVTKEKEKVIAPHPENRDVVQTSKVVFLQRKPVREVDTIMFITNAAVASHESKLFRCGFPPRNRDSLHPDYVQSPNKLKAVLNSRANLPFVNRIADFHLCLYLTEFFSVSSDFPRIVAAVSKKNQKDISAYQELIESYAGMD